jgi:uncharacterized BrkB/YihY/UPF0761 family membrane protein
MSHQPIALNIAPFVILWLVLIVIFRFAVKISSWRAIAYGTGISVTLILIAVIIVNWYVAKH